MKSTSLRFPDPGPALPEFVPNETTTFAEWETHRYQRFEHQFAFWRDMGPMYAQILATDGAGETNDGLRLDATIENWPITIEAQQRALTELMNSSQLRQAWRSYAAWQLTHPYWFAEDQQAASATLEAEDANSARPMREIPIYTGFFRVSCQQVICMPVRLWNAMFDKAGQYLPASIDETVVEKLATRLARALNEPIPSNESSNTPAWLEVWKTNPRALTVARDNHGLADRLFDEYLRPIEHAADRVPTWRFEGFYGQLRVDGINDEPWYVTVLAPTHFVAQLAKLVRTKPQ